jgi:hypothetical protein
MARHGGAREYGRTAFVSHGGRKQRRNTEQRGHDHARSRVERGAKEQPQGRRGHRDMLGRRARARPHSGSPDDMGFPATFPSSPLGSEHAVAVAATARAEHIKSTPRHLSGATNAS